MTFEIWLGEHYSHFERGVLHFEDGTTMPLKGWIHTATYGPDTLLIADEAMEVCPGWPVRWYIEENGLSFYNWDSEIQTIILHNVSRSDLEIGRHGILRAGETRMLVQPDI